MILIADSGSTKTTWCLLDNERIQTGCTSGINPYFSDKDDIVKTLEKEYALSGTVSAVYFYGSGCTEAKCPVVAEALSIYFRADKIEVHSDLLAAARSLSQKEEGIVCILGTGSNSCYYDGSRVVHAVPPLGYILGDEGSGAVLGKRLIGDVLKKRLPDSIIRDFFSTYSLDAAQIIERVYRQTFPNRFLAQFAPFLSDHIADEEIQKLVEDCFSDFIERNVLQYQKAGELPIHFTGGIAFSFRNNLENVLQRYCLQPGKISREPMPGLIEYHQLLLT